MGFQMKTHKILAISYFFKTLHIAEQLCLEESIQNLKTHVFFEEKVQKFANLTFLSLKKVLILRAVIFVVCFGIFQTTFFEPLSTSSIFS